MNYKNQELAEAIADTIKPRFQLRRFDELKIGTERAYLVKGLIPRTGLVVVWGPPKCGKSFWTFDVVLHVALGREYRGRRVEQGPIVYCAFEGASGYRARAEAFRQQNLPEDYEPFDFFLMDAQIDLAADHAALVASIRARNTAPAAVVLDTLNRSLNGSESTDKDMGQYIRAADAIREAFGCAVIIVHHCGTEGTRPRGHTSLTGSADAQLAVMRDEGNNVIVTVEWMKDGSEGDTIASRLEPKDVGIDADGDPISSCVVEPIEMPTTAAGEPKLSKNQQTMFAILHAAGPSGLSGEQWNIQAREAGLGERRKADLVDFKIALKAKGLVRQYGDRWTVVI
jgi:RecA-family ATPase